MISDYSQEGLVLPDGDPIDIESIYQILLSEGVLDFDEVKKMYLPVTYLRKALDLSRLSDPLVNSNSSSLANLRAENYNLVLNSLKKICLRYTYTSRGSVCNSNKASCVVIFNESDEDTRSYTANSSVFSYTDLPHFYISDLLEGVYRDINSRPGHETRASESKISLEEFEFLQQFKNFVESFSPSRIKYSRVMIHLYEDGKDYLGYHSDREGNEEIASLNLGVRRRFLVREKKRDEYGKLKKPIEFHLGEGDLLFMHGPLTLTDGKYRVTVKESCQSTHVHSVPKQASTKPGTRINFTFRKA